MPFNPDKPIYTHFQMLKDYIEDELPNVEVYDIVNSYPTADEFTSRMPLEKTIIHFDIANNEESLLGFGDNVVQSFHNDPDFELIEWQAQELQLTWDVGVWASARSGGVSARFMALDDLRVLFSGAYAVERGRLRDFEIMSYGGARFLVDTINDVEVYRVADIELVTRVFGRMIIPTQIFVADVIIESHTEIDGVEIP
jgi:hypothetical protein